MIKADYLNPLLFCHFETILIFKKEVKLHAKKTPIYKKPHGIYFTKTDTMPLL